ncbi:MAG: hypothetical protein H0X40_09490 [Chthoniobacterales bacterium]|nr:hypothetical protein [Chthoniobacterales bacterium]
MRKDTLTKDPFFLSIVAALEKKIGEGDRIARVNSIVLTDAQILSLLNKVAASARGKGAKSSPARVPRDQILAALAEQFILLRASIFEKKIGPDGAETETPLSSEPWIAAIKLVKKSIRLGTGHLRGSRGFLDSLGIFLQRTAAGKSEKQRSSW